MRYMALALALAVPLTTTQPAMAVDSTILRLIERWLDAQAGVTTLADVRERAGKGDTQANFILFQSYRTEPRNGAGPRVSSDMLVSRAEAETALRKAAKANMPEAVLSLGQLLFRGGMIKRNHDEAEIWLDRATGMGPEEGRMLASAVLGEILLFSPDSTDEDRTRGLTLAEDALGKGFPYAIRVKARALRDGVGLDKNPEEARKILEAAVKAGNGFATAPLGDMLMKGEGGPADKDRGIELLASDKQSEDGMGRAMLADLHVEGTMVPRLPRKAMGLMADHALIDLETRQKLGELIAYYGGDVARAGELKLAYQEDEDVGEKKAWWILVEITQADSISFRDDALRLDLLERHADRDDRIGVMWAEQLATFSVARAGSEILADEARRRIEGSIERGIAAAYTVKGRLLREGWVYEQDDVAATEHFLKAAEMGDVAGMLEVAEAYDDGTGVEEDAKAYVDWLRKAAATGDVEARTTLTRQFVFDTFDRLSTLREGITEVVALYGDQLGWLTEPSDFMGMFNNSRLDDFEPEEAILAFMDGFRASPAGLDDALLVPLAKELPQEVLARIEAELAAAGFYKGEAKGYFRPDARAALRAWVAAKGPLGPAPEPEPEPAPPVGPAIPDIPADVLAKATAATLERINTASTDEERAAGVTMAASLARFGDPHARFWLMRYYDDAAVVRAEVSPEEMARFGLDLMLGKDPAMEKLDIEFTFAITQISMEGKRDGFAAGFLSTLRDDARLANRAGLGEMLQALIFVPEACDAIVEAAINAGIEGLSPNDGCDNEALGEVLLAYAEKAGPSGIEAKARSDAVAEVFALAGATPP
jgi:TPR repeat protein